MIPQDSLWRPQTATSIEYDRLRREIATLMRIDEASIRPETRLGAIVPAHRRREVIQSLLRPEHVSLVRPLTLRGRVLLSLAASCLSFGLGLLWWMQPVVCVIATIVMSISVASMLRYSTSPQWPCCMETMQELALSQTRYRREDAQQGLWPREEISAKVRWVIAFQTGHRFDEISEQTHLVDLC